VFKDPHGQPKEENTVDKPVDKRYGDPSPAICGTSRNRAIEILKVGNQIIDCP